MRAKRPSIKDVARYSNTSISTVSNVINNRTSVSEQLRTKVIGAINELGYTVNPIARSLKKQKSYSIAVIVSDINCVFFAPLLKGIQNVLSKSGYQMIIYDSNYDTDNEMEYITTMEHNFVDGLILAGMSNSEKTDFYANRIADDQKPMPIVSLERDLTQYEIDSILIDNRQGAYTATSHLLEMGCKRIVTVTAHPMHFGVGLQRMDGYKMALKDADMPFREELICEGDFSALSGYVGIRRLLQTGLSFDGIFAANDQMAVGALRALEVSGLRVPEDIKVVGFDNTFIASIVQPALTTISVPNYEMGIQAAHRLLDRISNPERETQLVWMEYELIIRRSTVASARTNWDMEYW